MNHNRQGDAVGFPNDDKPTKRPLAASRFVGVNNVPKDIVRKAIDDAISSLGGPIHKTITWHMNNRGVFSNPDKLDINFFCDNLKELLGPGADMILEEAWQNVRKYKSSK